MIDFCSQPPLVCANIKVEKTMSGSSSVAVAAASPAAPSANSGYFPKCLQVSGPTDHPIRTRHEPIYSSLRKAAAEFVGTFVIVFAAISGPIVNRRYTGAETLFSDAACAGLAVMIIVSSLGHICGAHLNPAVTLAFAATRHFPWIQVPPYIVAQVSGSLCASFAIKGIFHPIMSNGVTIPSIGFGQAFALEAIISFTLMLVIVSVATDTRAVGEMAAIAIGGVVMLNILIAGPSTGASMNPARTLGPALAAGNFKGIWIYMVAPPLGAVAGACAYRVLKIDDDKDNGSQPPCDLRCFGNSDDVCVWKGYTVAIRNCNIPADHDINTSS